MYSGPAFLNKKERECMIRYFIYDPKRREYAYDIAFRNKKRATAWLSCDLTTSRNIYKWSKLESDRVGLERIKRLVVKKVKIVEV